MRPHVPPHPCSYFGRGRLRRTTKAPEDVEALDGPLDPSQNMTQLWAWEDEAAGIMRVRTFAAGAGIPEDKPAAQALCAWQPHSVAPSPSTTAKALSSSPTPDPLATPTLEAKWPRMRRKP